MTVDNIKFEYLNKADFSEAAPVIFNILADNMKKIAPTGNTREEDYRFWYESIRDGLNRAERQIVLIKNSDSVIGFFQYFTNENTFMMEEIQFKSEYQGSGVFRQLYAFLIENIRNDLEFVEAYANVNNQKSIAILKKLGLQNIGMNKNGHSYHFRGNFSDLIKWYKYG